LFPFTIRVKLDLEGFIKKKKKKLFKLSNNKVVHLIQSLTNEEHVDAKQTTIKRYLMEYLIIFKNRPNIKRWNRLNGYTNLTSSLL